MLWIFSYEICSTGYNFLLNYRNQIISSLNKDLDGNASSAWESDTKWWVLRLYNQIKDLNLWKKRLMVIHKWCIFYGVPYRILHAFFVDESIWWTLEYLPSALNFQHIIMIAYTTATWVVWSQWQTDRSHKCFAS